MVDRRDLCYSWVSRPCADWLRRRVEDIGDVLRRIRSGETIEHSRRSVNERMAPIDPSQLVVTIEAFAHRSNASHDRYRDGDDWSQSHA